MSKKDKMIENLARDICWEGFSDVWKPDCGKHVYWKEIGPNTRIKYIGMAKEQLFYIKKLGLSRYQKILTLISK